MRARPARLRPRAAALILILLSTTVSALADKPHSPILLDLQLIDLDPARGTGEALIDLWSVVDAPGTRVELILPSGFEADTTEWTLDLTAGQHVWLSAKWSSALGVAADAGNLVISARARLVVDAASSWGDMKSLPLHVDARTQALREGWAVTQVPVAQLAEPGDARILSMEPTSFSWAQERLSPATGPLPSTQALNPGDAKEPPPPLGPAAVTLTGRWRYQDRAGVQRDLDQQLLEVRRGDGSRIGGGVFCFTWIDGTFTCSLAHPGTSMRVWARSWTNLNPGPTRLGVFSGNEVAGGCGSDSIDCTYPVQTGEVFCADGTSCDVGEWFVINGAEPHGGAHQITQDLIRSWKKILFDNQHPGGTQGGPAKVNYPVPAGHGTHAHVFLGSTDPWISIEPPDQTSADVVNHEYGHAVHSNLWVGFTPNRPTNDCPSPHFIGSVSGPGCALSEGFANYWSWYSNEFYDGDNNAANDGPIYNDPGFSVNFETRDGGTWNGGDQVEGNVAGAMGDMQDCAADGPAVGTGGGDHICDGVQHIWHTIFSGSASNYAGWWSLYWNNFGHDGGPANEANFLNAINYGFVAHDNCHDARTALFYPYTDFAVTSDGYLDSTDPVPGCGNGSRGKSVWYRWTAPAPGTLTADTFGSDYDTILSTSTGVCGSFSAVAGGCNDDSGGLQSQVSFPVTPGQTYYFMITSFNNTGGNLTFHLNFSPAPPPNDNCGAALVLTGNSYSDLQYTQGASPQAGFDPMPPCGNNSNSNNIWYRFTAPVSGTLSADTVGSGYDTILSAYSGVCGGFSDLAGGCNDDLGGGSLQSRIGLTVTKGQTVWFMVSSFSPGGGASWFNFGFTPDAGVLPDGSAGGQPLDVFLAGGGDVTLQWGNSCLPTDGDYGIYEGVLGSYYSHYAYYCSTAGATTQTLTPSSYDTYYLVVPNNGVREGSYGRDSSGLERPAAFFSCYSQSVGACMPSCAHARCDGGAPLDPACDFCVADVCALNPYCCTFGWDSTCVFETYSICRSATCVQGTCAHGLCVTGDPLVPGCDDPPVTGSCVTTICGSDPYCCNTFWDQACVNEVASLCGLSCT